MRDDFFDYVYARFIQYLVIALVSIPVSIGYVLGRITIAINIVKLELGPKTKGTLGQIDDCRIVEITGLCTDEQLDFKRNRSHTYITQMMYGSMWELSKLASNQQRVPLIENHVLRHVLLNSVFCHALTKGDEDSDIEWILPITPTQVFDGCFWDVKEIRLHKNRHEMTIVDRTSQIHSPKSPTWNLAKAHAQTQLTFFAPGLAHNHVHFVFPTLMATQARNFLPDNSVLKQMLIPHTRFTQYINFQALTVCESSRYSGSLSDRLFKPWRAMPVEHSVFIDGIHRRLEDYYYVQDHLVPNLQRDLPYHYFLQAYYDVTKKFVEKLQAEIQDDYDILIASMSQYLPSLSKYDMVDVITTLIWNCGVQHYSDHTSYLEQFAVKYGCMKMRIPLVNGKDDQQIQPIEDLDLGQVLFASEDIYRTRCFLRTFVRYNENPNLDMTLLNTEYDFSNEVALNASKEFFIDLTDVDSQMRQRGEAIIPLNDLIRTVCF